jgi:ACS family hexuronate transporter-like MFS transporter
VHIPWLKLLGHRQTWAYTVGMVFSAPVWWFYLYWVPGFLFDKHGIDLKNIGLPLITIYLIADAGSIAGGWLSSALLKRGKTVNFARKATLVVCGLCAVPVVAASSVTHVWSAVLLIGLAAAGHAGFAANLYTLVSDTVPRKAVSSVVGIGGMAGSITGMFSAKLVGWILDWTIGTSGEPNYLIPFVVAGCAYLVATAIIHVLLPRMEVMEFEESQLTGRHGV